jgi:hypothetical protein
MAKILVASVFFIDGKIVIKKRSSLRVSVHAELHPESVAESFWMSLCDSNEKRLRNRQRKCFLQARKSQDEQRWRRKCETANRGLRKRARLCVNVQGVRSKVSYSCWEDRVQHERKRLFVKTQNVDRRSDLWMRKCNSVRHNMKAKTAHGQE